MNAAQRLQMQRDNIVKSARTSPDQLAALSSIMASERDAALTRLETDLNQRDRQASLLDRMASPPQVDTAGTGGRAPAAPQQQAPQVIARYGKDDGRRVGNSRAKNTAIRAREAANSPLSEFDRLNPAAPAPVETTAKPDPGRGVGAGVLSPENQPAILAEDPLNQILAYDPINQHSGPTSGSTPLLANAVPGFADGGRPPVGQTVLVGERGPELAVFDQPATIIPNHALPPVGQGAGYTRDRTMDPLTIGGITQPAGMRDTDFDRFMQGQGAEMLIGEQVADRRFDRQQQAMDERYKRSRADALADRDAERSYAERTRDESRTFAQRQKDMDTDALNEGYGLMLQRFGAEGALDDKDLAFWEHAKQRDPKAAAAIGKMLLDFGEENRAKKGQTPTGVEFLEAPDGSGFVPLTAFGDGSKRLAGGFIPNKTEDKPAARWVDLGDGIGYYADPQGNPIPTDKIMREESMPGRGVLAKDPGTRRVPAYRNSQRLQGSRNTLTGEMEWFDPTTGQQVIPGAATMPASPGASVGPAAATPAATVAPRTSRLLNMFK